MRSSSLLRMSLLPPLTHVTNVHPPLGTPTSGAVSTPYCPNSSSSPSRTELRRYGTAQPQHPTSTSNSAPSSLRPWPSSRSSALLPCTLPSTPKLTHTTTVSSAFFPSHHFPFPSLLPSLPPLALPSSHFPFLNLLNSLFLLPLTNRASTNSPLHEP